MYQRLLASLALLCGPAFVAGAEFETPVRMTANGASIQTDSPGFAYPSWVDVDGDGKPDLVVGQFAKGKMRVFKNQGDNKLAAGTWLQAEGKDAEVPGVW